MPRTTGAATTAAANTKILVERDAVEGHHDDLGTVIGARENLIVLVDVGHRPSNVSRVAILQNHARALHLVPLSTGGAALVAEDLLIIPRGPGVAVVLPIRDAVDRVHVPAHAIAGARIDDVVDAPAAPNMGIFLPSVSRIGHSRYRGPLRVDAICSVLDIGARGLLLH